MKIVFYVNNENKLPVPSGDEMNTNALPSFEIYIFSRKIRRKSNKRKRRYREKAALSLEKETIEGLMKVIS